MAFAGAGSREGGGPAADARYRRYRLDADLDALVLMMTIPGSRAVLRRHGPQEERAATVMQSFAICCLMTSCG
jgi:hypothetical protein